MWTSAQVLRWRPAVPRSIEINAPTGAWHSGRAHDVLDFADGSLLVGTEAGGVWWVSKGGDARALSDTWNDPDIVAVERGPDSQFHVYVATTVELKENRAPTLDNWQQASAYPPGCTPRDLAVLRGSRRLFLACTNGLWVANIPLPGAPRVYAWTQATGTGAGNDIASIAVKPTGFAWGTTESPTSDLLNANTSIVAVSRSPIHRDIFWIAPSGDIRTTYHQLGGTWTGHTFSITAPGTAHPNSTIAAVARGENHIDVFFMGPLGEVKTTWWDAADGNWQAHTYTIFPAGSATIGSDISVIARTPTTLDLFYVGSAGKVMHTAWPSARTWSAPVDIAAGIPIAATSSIAVSSRSPDVLNVFWISPGGEVRTNWWQQGNTSSWRNQYTLPSAGPAAPGGGIEAVGRDADKLDVVWVAQDGALMTTYWNRADAAHWNGHAYALSQPGVAALVGNVTLISRNPHQLDLFWRGADGSLRTSYWNGTNSGSFASQSYTLIASGVRNLSASSAFDEELTFYAVATDGRVTAQQWKHNDGLVLAGQFNSSAQPILKGTFASGSLTLAAEPLSGGDGQYAVTRIALSKYGRAAYAVVANPVGLPNNGGLPPKYVFRKPDLASTDAWSAQPIGVTNTPPEACTSLATCAGGQGSSRNGTIAVSPVDDNRVYVGWVGRFGSINGGATWQSISNEHLHDDVVRIVFADYDRTGRTAVFASDGGVAATFDGTNYFSRYNESLASLECYTTDGARQFDGSMSASYQVNNLIGAGLQDNGNVWAIHGTKWRKFEGGDGGYFTFVREPSAVSRLTFNNTTFARWEWDGSSLVNRGAIPVTRLKPAPPGGPASPGELYGGFVIVNAPVSWDAFGARIYGYNWSGTDIYSLWNPTGVMGWCWEYETTVSLGSGEAFNAGGSANGQLAFFGTNLGRIVTYNRRTGVSAVSPMNVSMIPNAADFGINRLTILSDTLGYALFNRWRNITSTDQAYVLRFDGRNWSPLPLTLTTGGTISATRFWSLDADWTIQPNTLLLTTDDKVYRSVDGGDTWMDESAGLPRRAHLADTRFVRFPDGTKRFYISTFGRSVWYADVR